MLSKDYLLLAINNQVYKYKSWVFSAFSVIKVGSTEEHPYKLIRGIKQYEFIDPDGSVVTISDSDVTVPLFTFKDIINLKSGDVVNLKKDVTTTVGQLLANAVGLMFPLGDKIEYQNGEFNLKKVEREIADRLVTDEKYRTKDSLLVENPITVSEYLLFIDSISALEGYSQLCVASATPRSLTTDPRIAVRRDELLKLHQGELSDPTVVANIEAELIAMDRAWLKGDPSEGFYIKDKHFNEVRKKAFIMYGLEGGFGVKDTVVTSSLSEGWGPEDMPAITNALREASYGRGKGTALGGYETKIVNRMFQNVKVTMDDCGTALGWPVELTKGNHTDYLGFYRVLSSGKPELIAKGNYEKFLGKSITMRSPQFCKAGGVNFCKTCLGILNSENENGLSSHVSAITSTLLNLEMKRMHNTAITLTKINLDISIS